MNSALVSSTSSIFSEHTTAYLFLGRNLSAAKWVLDFHKIKCLILISACHSLVSMTTSILLAQFNRCFGFFSLYERVTVESSGPSASVMNGGYTLLSIEVPHHLD